jgi:hypothetical protein
LSGSLLFAGAIFGIGLALVAMGVLSRVYEREEQLADILDLPWGEKDVDLDAVVQEHSNLVENTIGFAGRVVDQFDAKGALLQRLEKARLPVRAAASSSARSSASSPRTSRSACSAR